MKDACVILTNIFGEDCLRVFSSGESDINITFLVGNQKFWCEVRGKCLKTKRVNQFNINSIFEGCALL